MILLHISWPHTLFPIPIATPYIVVSVIVSTDVALFETTSFSLLSTVTSPEEDDDLLVYYVSLPVPTPAPIPIKPPIT